MVRLVAILLTLSGCAVGVAARTDQGDAGGSQQGRPPASDAGMTADGADNAATLCADPDTSALCTACNSTSTCQLNGCYNGYLCDMATNRCKAPGACP